MFFTQFARWVAVLALVFGALHFGIGLSTVYEWMPLSDFQQYARSSTPGEAIDRGLYMMLFAIALGTLAEIGLAIRRNRGP
jgi:uncharacterized membrane protein